MNAVLLYVVAACAALGACQIASNDAIPALEAPAWRPAPGQRVPFGVIEV